MSVKLRLGLDIGGTASRWVLCDESGQEVSQGQTSGATGHAFNPVERTRLQTVFSTIAEDIAAKGLQVGEIVAGITGYGASAREIIEDLLQRAFATGKAPILVDDMRIAYAAVFAPGEGYLVSAGTGSIGLFVNQQGQTVRVGGRGVLIDDAGSGSWIALRAIDRLFRHMDRTGEDMYTHPFGTRLAAQVGGREWGAVREFIYGGDRGRIGTLALSVAEAAREDDTLALAVLKDAGKEIARLALVLEGRSGARPIALIGGVLRLHPIILDTVRSELHNQDVSQAAPNAALFAARLLSPLGADWRALLER